MNISKEGMRFGSFALRHQDSSVEYDSGPPLEKLEEAFRRIYRPAPAPVSAPASSPAISQGGTSQVDAGGAACVPCSADHLSTVAGGLSEALRFARSDGLQDPQVQQRIALCFDELNVMERIDAAPSLLDALSESERALMRQATVWGRDLRHQMSDIATVEELESVTGHAQKINHDFRAAYFRLRFSEMSPEEKKRVKSRAREIIEAKLEEL